MAVASRIESECIYGNNECCNLVICLPNEIRFRFVQNVVSRRKCIKCSLFSISAARKSARKILTDELNLINERGNEEKNPTDMTNFDVETKSD